jgi:hypothetical protein
MRGLRSLHLSTSPSCSAIEHASRDPTQGTHTLARAHTPAYDKRTQTHANIRSTVALRVNGLCASIEIVIDSESESPLHLAPNSACPNMSSAADGGMLRSTHADRLADSLVHAASTSAAPTTVQPETVLVAVPLKGRSRAISSVSESKDEHLVALEITALLQSQVRYD